MSHLASLPATTATTPQASALPPGYIDGLVATVPIGSAGTTATVSAGSARDQDNSINLISASMPFDLAVSGAGGLDTGAIANSTNYWLYVISDNTGTTLNTLASISPTAPTLPIGYTKYVLVDRIRTQGTGKLIETVTSGRGKYCSWTPKGVEVSVSKSGTFGTPTAVDCSILTGGSTERHPTVSGSLYVLSATPDYCVLTTRSGGPVVRHGSGGANSSENFSPCPDVPLESSNVYIDRAGAAASIVNANLWCSSFVRGAL